MREIKLQSGHTMPILGLGTWALRGDQCRDVVRLALEMGYRHIDTAWMYRNQKEVGEGIRASGIDYEEIFLTTKIWSTHLRHQDVLDQHAENLDQLGFDYVDLLLIHWPSSSVPVSETLDAFAQLQETGKTRSIGVSNFSISQVDEARRVSRVPVAVNQVRYNIQSDQDALRRHCQENGTAVTAYSPLAKGGIRGGGVLSEVAERCGKTPAQVALRWLVQRDVVVIPKAGSEAHLRENLDLFDWDLSEEGMAALDGIAG